MFELPHISELIAGIIFLMGLVCVVWEFIGDPILVALHLTSPRDKRE